jgi:EAL domain-containing protein (putative c-di-GMP-specific phosphodiesterase class I)/FixJ family two-component response regulator
MSKKDKKFNVLIVEDDILQHSLLYYSLYFDNTNYGLFSAYSGLEAIELLGRKSTEEDFDVVVLDLRMEDGNGIELLYHMAEMLISNPKIILASGVEDDLMSASKKMALSYNLRIEHVFSKPYRSQDIRDAVRALYTSRRKPESKKHPAILSYESKELIDETKILKAIEDDQFDFFYQPQVNLETGKVDALEALLRWPTKDSGVILPAQFLEIIEENGWLNELSFLLLEKGLRQMQIWSEQDLNLCVSFNFAAGIVSERTFPSNLDRIVRSYNIAPSRITLEITEANENSSLSGLRYSLTNLRIMGYQTSLDDFGMGASSLERFNELPFSELKLDRSYVYDIQRNSEHLAIVESLIGLAIKLGVRTVAEGVETSKVYKILRDLGCTSIQGFYVSPAIEARSVKVWINRRNSEK